MSDEHGDNSEFKVIDRRKFTAEGDVRPDSEDQAADEPAETPGPKTQQPPPAPAPEPATESPQKAAPETEAAEEAQKEEASDPVASALGGVRFEQLIMSLVTTAMLQLGLAARQGEVPPPPDLPAAKATIDLIGILQQKTKGNLTLREDELLTGSLHELRMAFVEMTKQAGRIH